MAKIAINPSMYPLKGATVMLTPYLTGVPDYSRTKVNTASKMGTVTISEARTDATIVDTRGSDVTIASDRKYNVAITTNTFDQTFHDMITGNDVTTGVAGKPIPEFLTSVVESAGSDPDITGQIILTTPEPIATGGVMRIIVEDFFGNRFEKTATATALTEMQYHIDIETKTFTFNKALIGKQVKIMYFRASNASTYVSSATPVVKTRQFLLEFKFLVQGEGDENPTIACVKVTKVTTTGDLAWITAQKDPNSPITYSYTTASIPEGELPIEIYYEPYVAPTP